MMADALHSSTAHTFGQKTNAIPALHKEQIKVLTGSWRVAAWQFVESSLPLPSCCRHAATAARGPTGLRAHAHIIASTIDLQFVKPVQRSASALQNPTPTLLTAIASCPLIGKTSDFVLFHQHAVSADRHAACCGDCQPARPAPPRRLSTVQ